MSGRLDIHENGVYLSFVIAENQHIYLIHCSPLPFSESAVSEEDYPNYRLVELHVSGENQSGHHASKHIGGMPGGELRYVSHSDCRNAFGRKLEIISSGGGLEAASHLQFFDGVPVVRSWTEVKNTGDTPKGIEYISSFCLTGIAKEGLLPWERKSRVMLPHNTWFGEAQWKAYTLAELGLWPVTPQSWQSMKRLSLSQCGTWPCSEFLPMGYFENTESGSGLLWQIENNGSWQWEISDSAGDLSLRLSGPTEQESGWWKSLSPGETFMSAVAAVAIISGGFEKAVAEMTKYRRAIRRQNEDNIRLPVIFNDYMNCLNGDPTTEKELPLIDAAAETGCEYFVIDTGWYADSFWWDSVGEWLPSAERFPGGIKEPLDYIRSKGMTPGLWLELEVMGIHCPIAERVPDDWFFVRHGKRVIANGRYQLDYRNAAVRAFADGVIDRLVKEYGVGYIKMDYNINAGMGTETGADSFGDGLLGHNRAYLAWLDGVFARYPSLVIENCGSGGLRMEYALLSRHSIQSVTDQMDYKKMAAIAAACPTALTPEQAAIWSYPLADGDNEETIFNMVNAMLLRIHQSGQLAELPPERFALVKEGIAYYKQIRGDIPGGLPFWPLGLPSFASEWISLGLDCGEKVYLAVWRMNGARPECVLPIPSLLGKQVSARCGYPCQAEMPFAWNAAAGCLSVQFERPYMARLFELTIN